jgi:hypothetical protein
MKTAKQEKENAWDLKTLKQCGFIETYKDNTKKVEAPDLNMLFIDQIRNFAHLVKIEQQTKEQFLKAIQDTYSTANPKTALFYQATQKSTFNTIRLSDNRSQVLFNQ